MAYIMNYVFVLGIMCTWFQPLLGQATKDVNSSAPSVISIDNKDYFNARQAWTNSDKYFKATMNKFVRMAMPIVMREVYTKNISSDCLSGLLHLTTALKKTKLWAFKMIDANAKLPEGFLAGTLTVLGDYQECVDINVNETRVKLQGQYCSVNVKPPLPDWRPFMSIHLRVPEFYNFTTADTVVNYLLGFIHNLHVVKMKMGFCVPSVCNKHDVQELIQIIPEQTGLGWKFDVNRCELKQELSFTYTQTVILGIFGFLAILLACGTIAGIFTSKSTTPSNDVKGIALQCILSFSVFGNSKKLANYVNPHEELRFTQGITFICIFWILISNTFMYVNYHIASNFIEALHMTQIGFFEIVLNRTIPIQTFFYLSGFIAAYKWLKFPERNLSPWKYLLERYWRFTPTYILMIGLVMLTPTWGSGPSWLDHITPIYDKCRNNWWTNIFYINNFFDTDSACLDHTWIFAMEAQLCILGLVVLIPLKRRPAIGLMLNFVLIGASLLTIALTNVYYDVPPNEMLAFLSQKDRIYYASHTYYRIYTHICMYCSGILAAYFVCEKPKLKLPKAVSCVAWMSLTAAGLTVICVLHEWNSGAMPSPLIGAIYAAFGKVAWALFLSWIAITCASGNSEGANSFFGWRPFAFFARLAFTSYIIHPVLIQIVYAFKKSHLHVEQFELIYSVTSHAFSSYLLAYLCYMAFEAPFLSLTEVIRKKTKSSCFQSDLTQTNDNVVCNGVMTEKPMKYEDKRKHDEKLREVVNNTTRTKC